MKKKRNSSRKKMKKTRLSSYKISNTYNILLGASILLKDICIRSYVYTLYVIKNQKREGRRKTDEMTDTFPLV